VQLQTSSFKLQRNFKFQISNFGGQLFKPELISAFCFLLSAFSLFAQRPADKAPSAPLDPIAAGRQGHELATELLTRGPEQNSTNTGTLKIRDPGASDERNIPLRIEVFSTPANWVSIYEATPSSGPAQRLIVTHNDINPSRYQLITTPRDGQPTAQTLEPRQTMIPFAGSDFWIADLGLEFFHWPGQRLLKTEMRRGQSCKVLESSTTESANDYAKVVSWIDIDSGGIVHADAYDASGKILKEFAPTEFKKVHGQWQLEEMEILNRQTHSRTRIEFNVGKN